MVYAGNILEDTSTIAESLIKPGHFLVVIQERDPSDEGEQDDDNKDVLTWICKICETQNQDNQTTCLICNAPHPTRLSRPKGNLHCPQHHDLSKFSTPNAQFNCDKCGKTVAKDSIMYGCRPCDWDACQECFQKTLVSSLQCPGKHGKLTKHVTDRPQFWCDACPGEEKKALPVNILKLPF